MKTPKEYIKDFWGAIEKGRNTRGEEISGYDVALVIKYAQTEAYNQGILDLLDKSDGLDMNFQASKLLINDKSF